MAKQFDVVFYGVGVTVQKRGPVRRSEVGPSRESPVSGGHRVIDVSLLAF